MFSDLARLHAELLDAATLKGPGRSGGRAAAPDARPAADPDAAPGARGRRRRAAGATPARGVLGRSALVAAL
jgi:hypothetical protein